MQINKLGKDVTGYMFDFLSKQDIINCSLVCKKWTKYAKHKIIFRFYFHLTELVLNNNQLSGEIPAEFGNLINLEILHLENNQLTGEIPAELGNSINRIRPAYLDFRQ